MESMARQDLELMVALQDAERNAESIERELSALPAEIAGLDRDLAESAGMLESVKYRLEERKQEYRSLEAGFDTGQERARKRKAQLTSIKSNKDYQALLKEIDEIQSASSRLEDDMIRCLDDIEVLESELADAEAHYGEQRAFIDGKKQEIEENAAARREELARFQEKIQNLGARLDPGLKKRYYSIKAKSGGLAIVPVNGGICKGCHLDIPPQMYNELHRENAVRYCPHCYRLIYVL